MLWSFLKYILLTRCCYSLEPNTQVELRNICEMVVYDVLQSISYHITEVKNIRVEAVDCGARTDSWEETVIQFPHNSIELDDIARGELDDIAELLLQLLHWQRYGANQVRVCTVIIKKCFFSRNFKHINCN